VTITRVGTNKKFADGWSAIFGRGTKSSAAGASTAKKKGAPKKKAPKRAKK
jgi:hypothetical protein